LFQFASEEVLHVADRGCRGESCFVERDLVTIFEGAEQFDASEGVELEIGEPGCRVTK
jgi:hypothetical protein